MKAIPWGVMDLYKLHSNPEKLIHNGEFRYLPSQEALDDLSDYYENWASWAEDESSEGNSERDEWTVEFLNNQIEEDEHEYNYEVRGDEIVGESYRGALFDYSTEQLKIIHYYFMARMDGGLETTVQNFSKFYDEYRIRFGKKLKW